MHLSLREEPIGDSSLIEDFDGACVQTAGARSDEVLAGAPFDDGNVNAGNVNAGQRQLACQHQSGRTSSSDHYRMPLSATYARHQRNAWHRRPRATHTSATTFACRSSHSGIAGLSHANFTPSPGSYCKPPGARYTGGAKKCTTLFLPVRRGRTSPQAQPSPISCRMHISSTPGDRFSAHRLPVAVSPSCSHKSFTHQSTSTPFIYLRLNGLPVPSCISTPRNFSCMFS